ncbi:MAG TPA: DUF3303 family protein [Streptomyces sp.]
MIRSRPTEPGGGDALHGDRDVHSGPRPVYERARDRGRMLPDGLRYVESWVEDGLGRCFQLMETDDPALFDSWTAEWADLAEFEIVPVLESVDAAARALE